MSEIGNAYISKTANKISGLIKEQENLSRKRSFVKAFNLGHRIIKYQKHLEFITQ